MYGVNGLCNRTINAREKYFRIDGENVKKVCYDCGIDKGKFSFFHVDKLSIQSI